MQTAASIQCSHYTRIRDFLYYRLLNEKLNLLGFTAFEAGLLLLPGASINASLSPITGKMYDRYGAKPLFIVGLSLITLSMLAVIDLSSSTSFMYLLVRTIILRIGLAFITMPLNTAALNALPRELATHGSAINNTIRQLAGANAIYRTTRKGKREAREDRP